MTLLVAVLLAGTGLLVGAVGVGGFLVVPILVLLAGVPVDEAVVFAAISFVVLGIVAFAVRSRRAVDPLGGYASYLLAAAAGAWGGVLIVGALTNHALTWVIAAAFAAAAVAEWFWRPEAGEARPIGHLRSVALGALTGAGSAITGTSGPMVAMPLLAYAGVSTRERIGIAQVAQLPIALTATAAFLWMRDVSWPFAAEVALAIAAGFAPGIYWARALPGRPLSRAAALLMLLAAVSMVLGSWHR